MEAEFFHGDPLMVDHTPGSAVAVGEVVISGELPLVAHSAIAANELGALAAGGGVYKLAKTAGSSTAIGAGANIWWNNSSNVATTTASTHKHFGESVAAAADDDTYVLVKHNPRPALS